MTDPAALTDEQKALLDRERQRMAEPGYKDTLETPPHRTAGLTDEELAKSGRRAWNDGYKSGYADGYRAGSDAASPEPLPDEALILPNIQPDRGWAEHLRMPALIAALRAAQAEAELHRSRAERALELRRENGRLRAEVERLKAETQAMRDAALRGGTRSTLGTD